MAVLAVAAISARMMAEAAQRDGFDVIALDLFGDTDTRRAASAFVPIGVPGTLNIDPARVLAALGDLAARADVLGWVAGSGFDGRPELLAAGAATLPLIGSSADGVARVRDPALFFGCLAAHGIAHPPVQSTPPTEATGWLTKDPGGCGGWHIRRAPARLHGDAQALPATHHDPHHYYQREVPGMPMSATFIGNGIDAVLLGFNEQIVQPVAGRPFVFCGVVGPVPVPDDVRQRVHAAVRALAAEFGLRGLCSLDFMLDAGQISVLEVNPRPPASMALYAAQPLMRMHVRACLHGELPPEPASAACVNGHRIVFARRTMTLDAQAVQYIAGEPGAHDLPSAGVCLETGDPVCSLSIDAADAEQAKPMLHARCEQLLRTLETSA